MSAVSVLHKNITETIGVKLQNIRKVVLDRMQIDNDNSKNTFSKIQSKRKMSIPDIYIKLSKMRPNKKGIIVRKQVYTLW